MGKHSPSVAGQKVDRMIVVHLLVLVYSLGGCLGVHHSPEVTWESRGIAGNLDLLNTFSDSGIVSGNSRGGYFPAKHTVAHDALDNTLNSAGQNEQIREFSLKMLLENVAKLRHPNKKGRQIKISQTVRKGINANHRWKYNLRKNEIRTPAWQIQHVYSGALLSRHTGEIPFRNDPVHTNTWSNLFSVFSGEGQRQTLPSAGTGEALNRYNNILYNYFSVPMKTVTAENKSIQKSEEDPHQTVHKAKQESSVRGYKNRKLNTDDRKSSEFTRVNGNAISYLITPVNYLTGKDDTQYLNSFDKTLKVETAAQFDKRIDQHGVVLSELNTIQRNDDRINGENPDTVNSLIFKAVKKMEGIVKRRVYQYDTFLTTVQQLPDDDSDTMEEGNLSQDNNSRLLENGHISLAEYTHSEELRSPKAQLSDGDNSSVIEEVVNAVAERRVPKDIRFWQKLSDYLDSNDYRTRSRRSSEGRRRKGHRYMHLSITYGHVMPCEYRDRFYCMNGGTCVFVGALDIKTCRCPIGYTGVRCELIDQEYILSLLTNTLIFS